MAEAVYTAHPAARDLVQEANSKLSLPKNSVGQYDNNNISTLQEGISRVLGTQYNLGALIVIARPLMLFIRT